ncbi:hypothetical protein Tco_1244353 [Tanacetum coccineum]
MAIIATLQTPSARRIFQRVLLVDYFDAVTIRGDAVALQSWRRQEMVAIRRRYEEWHDENHIEENNEDEDFP